MTAGPPQVDFFYGLGSRYSYLASTQIARLETETGCPVRWRPLFSGDLFAARGRLARRVGERGPNPVPAAKRSPARRHPASTTGPGVAAMRSAGRHIATPTAFSSTRAASRSPAPPWTGAAPWKHSADLRFGRCSSTASHRWTTKSA